MKSKGLIVVTVVGMVVAAVVVTIFVLATGAVSVGADVKPGLIERTVAPWARERSVERHAPKGKDPYVGDAASIATGLHHYRENCLMCHGAPGMPISEVAKGLNPPAPALGNEENDTPDGELFWVTKHGIRMTAMPAFGPTHSDEEIWKIVAFLRHLPKLTAGEREYLRGAAEEEEHHHEAQGHEVRREEGRH